MERACLIPDHKENTIYTLCLDKDCPELSRSTCIKCLLRTKEDGTKFH